MTNLAWLPREPYDLDVPVWSAIGYDRPYEYPVTIRRSGPRGSPRVMVCFVMATEPGVTGIVVDCDISDPEDVRQMIDLVVRGARSLQSDRDAEIDREIADEREVANG